MKTIATLLLAFLLASCQFTDQEHFEVDKSIMPFVDSFYKQASDNGVFLKRDNLIIRFSNVIHEEGVLGVTHHGSITMIEIDYSIETKIKSDPLFFEAVLYHELGHALFHREHCETFSLMNPNKYVSDYRLNEEKRKALIMELITFP